MYVLDPRKMATNEQNWYVIRAIYESFQNTANLVLYIKTCLVSEQNQVLSTIFLKPQKAGVLAHINVVS